MTNSNSSTDVFVEETSWKSDFQLFESYGEKRWEDIDPIPSPPPIDVPPTSEHCTWEYNDNERVLLCKVNGDTLNDKERECLWKMMERNDISLILEGHYDVNSDSGDEDWFDPIELCYRPGLNPKYHRFRRFRRKSEDGESWRFEEIDGDIAMTFEDYGEYLSMKQKLDVPLGRARCASKVPSDNERQFKFKNDSGTEISLDIIDDVLYMIDLDFELNCPDIAADFKRHFMLREILPGGELCLTNPLNRAARPELGPNLYITPPGGFTQFHQDGHGTVDSGHLCLRGYNEVVMLRRLPEMRKKHALHLLCGLDDKSEYDALYGYPHANLLGGVRPEWASASSIQSCEEMGYCPSVFILKPGQQLHINKGRIHAFRKMTPDTLDPTDCHFHLRESMLNILKEEKKTTNDLTCVSIAWDWMFRGFTQAGINREIVSMLECAELNSIKKKLSLAIPEMGMIWNMISHLAAVRTPGATDIEHSKSEIAGMLPSFSYFVSRQKEFCARATEKNKHYHHKKIRIANLTDTKENERGKSEFDPFDNDLYRCKICHRELSNAYFHCRGCEKLLKEEFKWCNDCFDARKLTNGCMETLIDEEKSGSKCEGRPCTSTLRFRLFDLKYLQQTLESAEKVITIADHQSGYAANARERLDHVRALRMRVQETDVNQTVVGVDVPDLEDPQFKRKDPEGVDQQHSKKRPRSTEVC